MATYRLVIEAGVLKGKVFDVKSEGTSIGRSSKNNLPIPDGQLSRHHCRIYFLGDEPWISDLATLNGTLVNDKTISEAVKLNVGDTVSIGDTIFRFLDETDVISPDANHATVPKPNPTPGVATINSSADKIDLGFSGIEAAGDEQASASMKKTFKWAVAAFLAICVAAVAIKVLIRDSKDINVGVTVIKEPAKRTLAIRYTKLEGNDQNVFRYELNLTSDGSLTVSIDDLSQGRHVNKVSEKPVDEELQREIIRKFERSGFYTFDDLYEGIPRANTWNTYKLTATIDGIAKTVSVRNRIEPAAFKALREEIETFGRTELGLWAIEFSREKLLELARESQLVAQRLYDEREITRDNLFNAIRSFKSCISYLETLEPKPEFYDDAVNSLSAAQVDLETIYKEKNWQADHAINTKNWDSAAQILRELMEIIPDRTDSRNRDTERRLLDVESRIQKLRK